MNYKNSKTEPSVPTNNGDMNSGTLSTVMAHQYDVNFIMVNGFQIHTNKIYCQSDGMPSATRDDEAFFNSLMSIIESDDNDNMFLTIHNGNDIMAININNILDIVVTYKGTITVSPLYQPVW